MQLFYEIFPVFLFFLAFKFYGIYVATTVGIVATLLQVVINRWWVGKWDKKQLLTLFIFVLFGGMTLYFHNPIFVKWKPTIVFWVFALVILIYQLFTSRPLMQRLMQNMLEDKASIPLHIWSKINVAWAFFFLVLGAINLYIAYFYSNDAWVNFKFYGITLALFIFSLFQTLFLFRYLPEKKHESN
jgi:intracellular septation protein